MSHTYRYPRAALTVDCVVFGFDDARLKVLLVRRGLDPFQGCWALPGGFVDPEESLEEAARRELEEETGLKEIYLEQLYTFGDLGRDPRERVVSVAYFALVRRTDHQPEAGTDAAEAIWWPADEPPDLAFDHDRILRAGLDRLRGKIRWQPLGFELLPHQFTLTQLQSLYEAVLGRPLDKRNFRKKILAFDLLLPTEDFVAGAHRPARLYRFDRRKYALLARRGFHFEI